MLEELSTVPPRSSSCPGDPASVLLAFACSHATSQAGPPAPRGRWCSGRRRLLARKGAALICSSCSEVPGCPTWPMRGRESGSCWSLEVSSRLSDPMSLMISSQRCPPCSVSSRWPRYGRLGIRVAVGDPSCRPIHRSLVRAGRSSRPSAASPGDGVPVAVGRGRPDLAPRGCCRRRTGHAVAVPDVDLAFRRADRRRARSPRSNARTNAEHGRGGWHAGRSGVGGDHRVGADRRNPAA